MFDSLLRRLRSVESLPHAEDRLDERETLNLVEEASGYVINSLQSAAPGEVRVHPLGFVKVHVEETNQRRVRVHLWAPPLYGPSSAYDIHTHSFSAVSHVLAGALENVTYAEVDGEERHDGAEYLLAEARAGTMSTALDPTTQVARLRRSNSQIRGVGDSYWVPRDTYHSSHPRSDFVATFFVHLRHADSRGVSSVAMPSSSCQQKFPYSALSRDVIEQLVECVQMNLTCTAVSAAFEQ